MRISFQHAYILHHRPYRETSVLLDILTQEHGRISLIARGVRTLRSRWRALLQPFTALLISWQGRSELMTLVSAENNGKPLQLSGDCLLGGFYLNELLMRVLHKHDPHPRLYTIYQQAVLELQGPQLQQQGLRLFEKKLLEELGYGLQLQHDVAMVPFIAEAFYRFYPEQGFKLIESNIEGGYNGFSGKSLLALAKEQLDDVTSLREAKRLMRLALTPLLGTKPLHSRKLFMSLKDNSDSP